MIAAAGPADDPSRGSRPVRRDQRGSEFGLMTGPHRLPVFTRKAPGVSSGFTDDVAKIVEKAASRKGWCSSRRCTSTAGVLRHDWENGLIADFQSGSRNWRRRASSTVIIKRARTTPTPTERPSWDIRSCCRYRRHLDSVPGAGVLREFDGQRRKRVVVKVDGGMRQFHPSVFSVLCSPFRFGSGVAARTPNVNAERGTPNRR